MRRALIILSLVAGLLVGVWYAFCIWCGWWQRIEPPAMHLSWSEQQKYDLLALDNELRYNPICAPFGVFRPSGEMSWWEEKLYLNGTALAWGWRRFSKPARKALHEAMAMGRGDVRSEDGYPVALYALRFHKVKLVKALVEHGCNPAAPYIAWDAYFPKKDVPQSNLLVDALDGSYMDYTLYLSSRDKLELLDFMEHHGAKIDTVPDVDTAVLKASYGAVGQGGDGGAALAWLLRRGLPLNDEQKRTVQTVLEQEECRDTRSALQREGLMPAENAGE